jgi:hypothetical protein
MLRVTVCTLRPHQHLPKRFSHVVIVVIVVYIHARRVASIDVSGTGHVLLGPCSLSQLRLHSIARLAARCLRRGVPTSSHLIPTHTNTHRTR